MRTVAFRFACAIAACALPALAQAQDQETDGQRASGSRGRVMDVMPYIEAGQVLAVELSPGNDTVTYSSVAAGVDATIAGRNSAGSASVRYERRFGWDDDSNDGDTLSGVARASLAVVPQAVTIEAGALAARTRVEGSGATSIGGFGGVDDSTSQVYTAYAGPSVRTQAGDVEVEGHYRFGYTSVESPEVVVLAPGAQRVDIVDESTVHMAAARAGVRPNTALPIGVGVGGGWNEQNISNLDQRIVDRHARADVTVPLSPTVAVAGGVGYEDVEISSRDALRDAAGNPVIGPDGRYVTNENAPRVIAYETDGIIWDAGVQWRPSRRTSLEAYVGRRYGSETYFGSFAYAPNSRSSLNVVVYDNLTGFGGALVDRLAGLPTQFDAFRNPITGEIGGCVASTTAEVGGNNCIAGALSSLRSAVFRSRGVALSYGVDLGRTQFGTGVGYDRRTFIAAAGTVLAPFDGAVDETIWWAAYANSRLDQLSTLSANVSANWFDGEAVSDQTIGYTASLAYNRNFLGGLSGTAAVGLDGITREDLPDFTTASALLGLRYSF
jgi:hypothetical protein